MTTLPAIRFGAATRASWYKGKFHGCTPRITPSGALMSIASSLALTVLMRSGARNFSAFSA